MSSLRNKFTIFIVLFIGILIGIFVKTARDSLGSETENVSQQLPRVRVAITITEDQWDVLFEKFEEFANEQAFAIRIAPSPETHDFLVQMWREDVKITAVNSGDPNLVKVGFYDTNPLRAAPQWVYESMLTEWKGLVDEIPNATFSEY